MPKYSITRLVNHHAQDMFDLVADVEKYPEFLPMCEGLQIVNKVSRDGIDVLIADMQVGYKFISESFCTEVSLNRNDNTISTSYIDGPFKYLHNKWTFRDIPGRSSCLVDFFIDYEFRTKMMSTLMGMVFDRAFSKFAEAFEERANILYKKTNQ